MICIEKHLFAGVPLLLCFFLTCMCLFAMQEYEEDTHAGRYRYTVSSRLWATPKGRMLLNIQRA
jgi:hypothetical protein